MTDRIIRHNQQSMFEIPKDQLLRLSDTQLRELVARLCEAELREKGFSPSSVRCGGAQTALDGGLDVDCRVEAQSFKGGYVPRARTGFQVKMHTMPAGKIKDEMSPKGSLRPIFSALASENGGYAIVSLADDIPPAGPMLQRRLSAMEAQVKGIKDQGPIELRFCGRGDLAHWLRQHPGVQLWVREALGLPLLGWRPFGRWARTPLSVNDDLICKKGILIRPPRTEGEGLEISPGIEAIRQLVRSPGKSVRIVGLSGVGKTRIVQALFEEGDGTDALSKHLAIYADLGESPQPSARDVINSLAAEQRDAIVVLDNCSSPRHEKLATLVADMPAIQLISIEYDIQEDKPEATNVFHIDAKGPDIAEALLLRRYPVLGPVNARRIAVFSGGNARLAILLADAVEDEGNLSEFSNQQLFERLFNQRKDPDGDLLAAAEVLALVYSFSMDKDEEGVDELDTLARILGQDRRKLFRTAQTLVERQLAQKRGRWRAILPHAVANRLAAKALRNIDFQEILNAFEDLPTSRLLMSFGKRLGYLHDHEVAQEIAESWLSPDGILHEIGSLSGNEFQLLKNIVPVAPERVLSAIEDQARSKSAQSFFSDIFPRDSDLVGLLVSIAYDPGLFERCIHLLSKLALGGSIRGSEITKRISALFSQHLSGTEAPPELREQVVRRFLQSTDQDEQGLGLEMLKSALHSGSWTSVVTLGFGARARTLGYQPKTVAESDDWFLRFIALCEEMTLRGDLALSDKLRDLIAEEFSGLWDYSPLRPALAALVRSLHAGRPWVEGWRAVRRTKFSFYPGGAKEHTESSGLKALNNLDRDLRPQELTQEVKTYVLTLGASIFSQEDDYVMGSPGSEQESYQKAAENAHSLGNSVASDAMVLDAIGQEFFTFEASYAAEFGRGLAEQTEDLEVLLDRLMALLELAGEQARQCDVLKGVLQVFHERNARDAEAFLDAGVERPALRRFVMDLHRSIPFSEASVGRLLRAMSFPDTPVRQFANLGLISECAELTERDVERLMCKLLERADGAEVVLQGMSGRLHLVDEGKSTFGLELKRVSLIAAAQLLRRGGDVSHDSLTAYFLSKVLRKSINEAELADQMGELLEALSTGLKLSHGRLGNLNGALAIIAEETTEEFLDCIFFESGLQRREWEVVFRERREGSPLSAVDVSRLVNWCEQGDFERRLVLLAEAICPFEKGSREGELKLTAQAHFVVDAATNPSAVFEAIAPATNPGFWVGNRSDSLEKRRKALKVLLQHDRADIRDTASVLIERMRKWEEEQRQRERAEDEWRGQRFE